MHELHITMKFDLSGHRFKILTIFLMRKCQDEAQTLLLTPIFPHTTRQVTKKRLLQHVSFPGKKN